MANPNLMNEKHVIDVVKYRFIWFLISALFILPCLGAMIYSIITTENHAPLKLGIDFEGGTILQYEVDRKTTVKDLEDIRIQIEKAGIEHPVIQSIAGTNPTDNKNFLSVKTKFIGENSTDIDKVTSAIQNDYKDAKLIQTNSVGPALGSELLKNSLISLTIAFIGIIIYISFRFQLDYAVIAVLALLHDAIFVIGAFSLMSLFLGTQIDSLFITAVLTVIGFSVHDTIVVFDRIRENNRFLSKKYSFNEIVNASVNQTLARSINTSLTTLLTLTALYIFGGTTTKDFVFAMILGILIGTYSSIFFASALLAWWEEKKANKKINA